MQVVILSVLCRRIMRQQRWTLPRACADGGIVALLDLVKAFLGAIWTTHWTICSLPNTLTTAQTLPLWQLPAIWICQMHTRATTKLENTTINNNKIKWKKKQQESENMHTSRQRMWITQWRDAGNTHTQVSILNQPWIGFDTKIITPRFSLLMNRI